MVQMAKDITVEEIIVNVNARFIAGIHVQNKLSPRYFYRSTFFIETFIVAVYDCFFKISFENNFFKKALSIDQI